MYQLEYTPKALEDLERLKDYLILQYGTTVARRKLQQLLSAARQLELFPKSGPSLETIVMAPTDYRYMVVKSNYIFYRIKENKVKIIRILNEKQDFMQILF